MSATVVSSFIVCLIPSQMSAFIKILIFLLRNIGLDTSCQKHAVRPTWHVSITMNKSYLSVLQSHNWLICFVICTAKCCLRGLRNDGEFLALKNFYALKWLLMSVTTKSVLCVMCVMFYFPIDVHLDIRAPPMKKKTMWMILSHPKVPNCHVYQHLRVINEVQMSL